MVVIIRLVGRCEHVPCACSSFYLILFVLLVSSSFKIKATRAPSATLFSIWQCSHIFSPCWLGIRSPAHKKTAWKRGWLCKPRRLSCHLHACIESRVSASAQNVLYIPITEQHICVGADALLQQHCPLLSLPKTRLLRHRCSTYINTQAHNNHHQP